MSVAACARIVARADPDRFAATMLAPLPAREILFPLYALTSEIARAPWVTQEAMIAEMRLQWWRDALDEIAQGKPARRHEVVTPAAAILPPGAAHLLDKAANARRWDIYKDTFEDAGHFEEYLMATAGGVMWAAGLSLGAAPADEAPLRAIGWAGGLAAFLRAVPALEALGRIPLVDGRAEAVQALAGQGLARLAGAGALTPAARPASYPAWQTRALLAMAQRQPQRVASGALAQSEFRRRVGLVRLGLTGRVPR